LAADVGEQTARMPTLLVVHHTPSPALQAMLDAVLEGAGHEELADVDVVARAALAATAVDVLGADAVLLGTPANMGYMSGALKHFFDTVYYPVLQEKAGTPYGLYVHGGSDTTGAIRSVETLATGLSWRAVAAPLTVTGELDGAGREACRELGGTVAASLVM
jgi:multimeric flavodoxin WrbA